MATDSKGNSINIGDRVKVIRKVYSPGDDTGVVGHVSSVNGDKVGVNYPSGRGYDTSLLYPADALVKMSMSTFASSRGEGEVVTLRRAAGHLVAGDVVAVDAVLPGEAYSVRKLDDDAMVGPAVTVPGDALGPYSTGTVANARQRRKPQTFGRDLLVGSRVRVDPPPLGENGVSTGVVTAVEPRQVQVRLVNGRSRWVHADDVYPDEVTHAVTASPDPKEGTTMQQRAIFCAGESLVATGKRDGALFEYRSTAGGRDVRAWADASGRVDAERSRAATLAANPARGESAASQLLFDGVARAAAATFALDPTADKAVHITLGRGVKFLCGRDFRDGDPRYNLPYEFNAHTRKDVCSECAAKARERGIQFGTTLACDAGGKEVATFAPSLKDDDRDRARKLDAKVCRGCGQSGWLEEKSPNGYTAGVGGPVVCANCGKEAAKSYRDVVGFATFATFAPGDQVRTTAWGGLKPAVVVSKIASDLYLVESKELGFRAQVSAGEITKMSTFAGASIGPGDQVECVDPKTDKVVRAGVTAASGGQLTVRGPDGSSWSCPATQVVKAGGGAAPASPGATNPRRPNAFAMMATDAKGNNISVGDRVRSLGVNARGVVKAIDMTGHNLDVKWDAGGGDFVRDRDVIVEEA